MGLYMQLNKKVYLPVTPSDKFIEKTQETWDLIGVNPTAVEYVSTKFAVWHNAYSIHNWFVNLWDYDWIGSIYVSYENIEMLKNAIEETLESRKRDYNPIPMAREYGKHKEWYIKDLAETLEIVNKALEEISQLNVPTIEFEYIGGW